MWLTYIIACVVFWALSEVYYKKGSDPSDSNSHLKFLVWIGITQAVGIGCLLPFSESGGNFVQIVKDYAGYIPLLFAYVGGVTFGIIGTRYMELSVLDPLENMDGVIASVVLFFYFWLTGDISKYNFSILNIIGVVISLCGVVYCGILEQRYSNPTEQTEEDKKKGKHKLGAAVLIFPLIYNLFDGMALVIDGIVLGDENGIGEIDYLIITGVAFIISGMIAWLYLYFSKKIRYNPFSKKERVRCKAASTEFFGNAFFAFAMAQNPILSGPVSNAYVILTVIAARVILKEKLRKKQYICIGMFIVGILLMGISELI